MIARLDIDVVPEKNRDTYPDEFRFTCDTNTVSEIASLFIQAQVAKEHVPRFSVIGMWWNKDDSGWCTFNPKIGGVQHLRSSGWNIELQLYSQKFRFVSEEEDTFVVIQSAPFTLDALRQALQSGKEVWHLNCCGEEVI